MKSNTTDAKFSTDNHYKILNSPNFLDESLHLTEESKALYKLGAPGQGYVGLVDLVDKKIHLVPCFNKDDGLLRVNIDGKPFTKYVESEGALGQITGDLHQKACAKLDLWVSAAQPGKGAQNVLGFGVWKQGTAIKFLDDLPKPSGRIPDEFIFIKKDNHYQLFYIDFDRKTQRFEISENPELCAYLKTCASEGKPIDREKIEANIREHYKHIIKQTSLPFKSAKNRSTSQNAVAVEYSEEYKEWFTGRNRGHTAHKNDLIRELPFEVFKKILDTIFQNLGFSIPGDHFTCSLSPEGTASLFPAGTDGIADHLKLEMSWMNASEKQQRFLEYALITQNQFLVEQAIHQGGKIASLPMKVLIDYAVENNKNEVIQLMVDYAIRGSEGITTLISELKKRKEESAQERQPFKKFLSDKITLLENENNRKELIDKWIAAVKDGKVEVIQELLEAKAIDPNFQLSNGTTALYMAAENGKDEVVNALLTKGANPDLDLQNGWTPLLVAAGHRHMKVVEMLMQNTHDFRTLLTSPRLNDTQKSAIFVNTSIRTKLPQFLTSLENFSMVLPFLTSEQTREIFKDKSVQEKFAPLITSMEDLSKVLRTLKRKQKIEIFENKGIQEKLPQLITNAEDFSNVLVDLTPEQKRKIFVNKSDQEKLSQLIMSSRDFCIVFCGLTPEQKSVIYESVRTRLPQLMTSAKNFFDVLAHLTLDQKREVLESQSVQEKLPQFITSAEDFFNVLYDLTSEQKTTVFENKNVQEKLPQLITSVDDFIKVIRSLAPEQITAVLVNESIKTSLPQLITSMEDFSKVFRHLDQKQKREVFEVKSIQEKLPQLITSAEDFSEVICGLTPEQITAVFAHESIKTRLPRLITNADDFSNVFSDLILEQKREVFDNQSVQKKLPQLITSADDFIKVLRCLIPEQITAVLVNKSIKTKLSQLITDEYDLINLLHYLTPEQITAIFANESIKTRLPQLIKSAEYFSSFMESNSIALEKKIAITASLAAALASDRSGIINPKTSHSPYSFQQTRTQKTNELPEESKHVPNKTMQKPSS